MKYNDMILAFSHPYVILYRKPEKLREVLVSFLPEAEVFIVDSFPMPLCDFKRAHGSKSPPKGGDATGTQATYGHTVTKGLRDVSETKTLLRNILKFF